MSFATDPINPTEKKSQDSVPVHRPLSDCLSPQSFRHPTFVDPLWVWNAIRKHDFDCGSFPLLFLCFMQRSRSDYAREAEVLPRAIERYQPG